jgi:hypothetical protein
MSLFPQVGGWSKVCKEGEQRMFEDTLIESEGRIKTHRKATTLVSFLLEAILIAIVALLPLRLSP